jgi:hypothetical protein
VTNDIEQEEYKKRLAEMIGDFSAMLAQGVELTTDDLVAGLSLDKNNSLVREWATKNAGVSKADFDSAVRRGRIKEELGRVPSDAVELVDVYVEQQGIVCQYNGQLHQTKVVPYLVGSDGKKLYCSREDREDPVMGTYCDFMFRNELTVVDLERRLRLLKDRLKLGLRSESISDAVEEWYERAKAERLYEIFLDIGHLGKPHREAAEAEWRRLGEAVFETTDDEPLEFVIAVLKKFMHQVKRKMRGLPITDHLMPVLLGRQGVGKSTFVHQMLEPVKEISLNVDFKMIADERNIEIWDSYVLFLDEMGYASKTDVDSIKNIITASVLSRRPMRTNLKITVAQNATLIGGSNKKLPQLIKDPTGLRRFVGLHFRHDPDWQIMNSVDWERLWKSVDFEGPCPIQPFKAVLSKAQEQARDVGRVEDWLRNLDPKAQVFEGRMNHATKRISAADLFVIYSDYEAVFFPGPAKMSKTEWDHEVARLLKDHPEVVPFEKSRDKRGIIYQYTG